MKYQSKDEHRKYVQDRSILIRHYVLCVIGAALLILLIYLEFID